MESLFDSLGVTKYKACKSCNKKGKGSHVRITNKRDVQLIGNYLYQGDNSIRFKRKRLKFDQMMIAGKLA